MIFGLTFKENCPDLRNSKAFDLLNLLKKYSKKIDIYDPFLENYMNDKYFNSFNILKKIPSSKKIYDLIMIIVPHKQFLKIKQDKYLKLVKRNGYIYDFKDILGNHKSIIKV